MSLLEIPRLDLADFRSGDIVRRNQFIRALGRAFEETGFATVVNHRLNADMRENIYEQLRQFFSLPQEVRNQYRKEGLAGQRGYTPTGQEHAKGRNTGDLKEFFQFGQAVRNNPELKGIYPANVHVEELPQFNPTAMQAYKALEADGAELLEAIAVYLNLDADYFSDKIYNGNSILRAIHYPPITDEPKDAVRAAAHEDINLITLLTGPSAEGLEILTRNNKWVAIKAADNALVVNVGDMLQRLTNNTLRSTTHRVVNPPKKEWKNNRYSIPFFLHPRSDMDLSCLESCVDSENPKQYDDIRAGEYLDERLREIGLK